MSAPAGVYVAPFPLVYRPDFQALMLSSLLGQDRNRPVMVAWAAAVGSACQTVEDAVFDFASGILFYQATGAALDRWGDVVGQPRLGLVDRDYRRVIGARILINRCTSSIDEVTKILGILADTTQAWYASPGPMVYVLGFVGPSPTPNMARAIRRAMEAVRGLGCTLSAISYGPSGVLVLADEPSGTAMTSGAAGLQPVPAGYESRLDVGTLGADL